MAHASAPPRLKRAAQTRPHAPAAAAGSRRRATHARASADRSGPPATGCRRRNDGTRNKASPPVQPGECWEAAGGSSAPLPDDKGAPAGSLRSGPQDLRRGGVRGQTSYRRAGRGDDGLQDHRGADAEIHPDARLSRGRARQPQRQRARPCASQDAPGERTSRAQRQAQAGPRDLMVRPDRDPPHNPKAPAPPPDRSEAPESPSPASRESAPVNRNSYPRSGAGSQSPAPQTCGRLARSVLTARGRDPPQAG